MNPRTMIHRPIIPIEPRRALQLRSAAAKKLDTARRRKKGGIGLIERELVRLTAASLAWQQRAQKRATAAAAPSPIADLFGQPELVR